MTHEPKEQLASDYNRAAGAYEKHWGPVLARLAQDFLDELSLARAKKILDVGAGTGRLIRVLENRTQATVVGVDRSEGMLGRAPTDSPRAVMDAEQLAFADDSFDVAIAFFMLFHLSDPLQGLREIRRVVSDEGMVALMTWGEDDMDFRGFEVWDEILDRLGAAEGRAFFSQHEFTDSVEKCSRLLENAGFIDIDVRAGRMSHTWTVEDMIGFRTGVGSGRVRWESLSQEARAEALREGRRTLREFTTDEITLRDEVIYSVGHSRFSTQTTTSTALPRPRI